MHHLRHLLVATTTLIFALSATGQERGQAARYFSEAPSSVIQFIEPGIRLDMIDYFEAGQSTPSANNVGGECRITSMTPTSLSYQAGDGVHGQIFVLGEGKDALIGVILTADSPMPDSDMKIYDTSWHQILKDRWVQLRLDDWLTPEGRRHRAEVEEALPWLTAEYLWDDATGTIVATSHVADLFTADDTPAALQWLRPSVTYVWKGGKFKAQR